MKKKDGGVQNLHSDLLPQILYKSTQMLETLIFVRHTESYLSTRGMV